MTAPMDDYLEAMQLSDVARGRLDDVLAGFRFLAGGPITTLFISNVMDVDTGKSEIESVWGFTDAHWLQARNFITECDIDISPYRNAIEYVGVQYENIDWPSGINADSRMKVEVRTAKVDYSTLFAVGTNCNQLVAIFDELLRPNLRTDV